MLVICDLPSKPFSNGLGLATPGIRNIYVLMIGMNYIYFLRLFILTTRTNSINLKQLILVFEANLVSQVPF